VSDDTPHIVRRCEAEARSVEPVFPSIADALRVAAAEIVALRTRVAELEAENAAFREQFATADEVTALMAEHGANLADVPGWVEVNFANERDANNAHHAQELSFWHDLADQLAEALSAVRGDRPTIHSEPVWLAIYAALAAYDRAHTPEVRVITDVRLYEYGVAVDSLFDVPPPYLVEDM
jgi:hypothetical protein